VFLENKPGQLAAAVKLISEGGVNIRALSLADTRDFGILRLIVSDNKKAKELLAEKSIVTETPVIAVKMEDEAGALNRILQSLQEEQINVEYLYAFTGAAAYSAYTVLRVDDAAHAELVLKNNGVSTLSDAELMELL
jgi:hypothetical protein